MPSLSNSDPIGGATHLQILGCRFSSRFSQVNSILSISTFLMHPIHPHTRESKPFFSIPSISPGISIVLLSMHKKSSIENDPANYITVWNYPPIPTKNQGKSTLSCLLPFTYLSVIPPSLSVPASVYDNTHNTSTHTDRSTVPRFPASVLLSPSTSGSDPRCFH